MCKPYSTSAPLKLLLFNGSANAFVLDLFNNSLTPKTLDLSTPPGFNLIKMVSSSRLVFFSDHQILIREIPMSGFVGDETGEDF